jgi:UMF1 family MFS transporter
MALVGRGDLWLAIALIVASNFFFGTGENLVAAFLPELSRSRTLARVSGWGWSLGYLGGLLSLGASLAYITWAQARGETAAAAVPVTMLITAALFAAASIPTFVFLRERARPQAADHRRLIAQSLRRVRETWREASRYRDLAWFLACIVVYQAGIQTVITLAAVYAEQAMGFTTRDTLFLILVVNVMAAAGAFAFGYVQDRVGHVRMLAATLGGWLLAIVFAWSARGPALFWVAATLVGICLGSSQSGGRALVGYLSPAPKRAEFFGLWGLAVKLSSILGPITYGIATWMSRGDHRLAILVTGVYFVLGAFMLANVDAERGHRIALDAAAVE